MFVVLKEHHKKMKENETQVMKIFFLIMASFISLCIVKGIVENLVVFA